jgi:3-dehydroquinate dehydratase-2
LGQREPELYGQTSLSELHQQLAQQALSLNGQVRCMQSNHEGQLIDWIHEARTQSTGLIINPGGYTHTSVALRDALLSYTQPIVEVHLTNTAAREAFRHQSYISPVVTGTITGLGLAGYQMALQLLLTLR